jgi:hypothetical protein
MSLFTFSEKRLTAVVRKAVSEGIANPEGVQKGTLFSL